MSFDQNQDIKGEKKPPVPTEETPKTTSSNYEDFGTSGADTLLEMPAIDPETLQPEKVGSLPNTALQVAQPMGILSSQPTLTAVEAPVSQEALAWLNGDEPAVIEAPQTVIAPVPVPSAVELSPTSIEATLPPEEPKKTEAPSLPEAPKMPETLPIPEAPKLPVAETVLAKPEEPTQEPKPAETIAAEVKQPAETKPAAPETGNKLPETEPNEDSIELVEEEIKTDSEEELSSQINWSKSLPEKQEAEPKAEVKAEAKVEAKPEAKAETKAPPPPIPSPKLPPPTPKSPPPPVPSGPHKAVSNPNLRVDTPRKPISKLDLPPELFEDDPPTKSAEAQAQTQAPSPTPTVQIPKVLPKGWWDTIFNEDFLRTNPAKSEAMTRKEADFIEQNLVPKPGDSILDIACGYGRHVIEMSSRNYNMVGLDLSLPYLMLAAEISTRRKLMANFIHGDMRDLQFKEYFDHAYCVFTSFGYFDDETNMESLRGIYRSLKPKGRFLLEVINRDFAVSACPLRGWWEGIGCVMLEETEFNYNTSVLSTKRSVIFEDGRQAMQETHVRLYSLHELTALYKAAGFKILEISGGVDLRGVFFGSDSTHLVILAEKQR